MSHLLVKLADRSTAITSVVGIGDPFCSSTTAIFVFRPYQRLMKTMNFNYGLSLLYWTTLAESLSWL